MSGLSCQVLILFAHPALQRSRVNRVLIRGVQELPGVTFRDLYEIYPEFDIDAKSEQSLLTEHEIIIFHHPFFWYSTPAILKEWQDLVLEHGWAYGTGGTALHGKKLLSVLTTGGSEAAYQRKGYNRFTIRELLAPIEQTAALCGMDYLPPFVVHGTLNLNPDQIAHHAADYIRTIEGLRDGMIDLAAARNHPRLNSDLDSILRG